MTDAVDNLVGTGADETFVASASNVNAGDQLEGGAGTDTLQLTGNDYAAYYHLENFAKLSGIEIIRGTDANDHITIGSTQWTDVLTIDGGLSNTDLGGNSLSLSGDTFDLRGKTVSGFGSIHLLEGVQQVTVDKLETAQLINGTASQGDHLIITSVDLTDAEREAYFLRGIDTITDKSGRTTSNAAPHIVDLDGDKVKVLAGHATFLDAGKPVALSLEDTDLYFIQFYAEGAAAGDPDFHLEIWEAGPVSLGDGMNANSQITVYGTVIGYITDWTDQWTLDIEFYGDTDPYLVQTLLNAIIYRNSSADPDLVANYQVKLYIEDTGGRFTEATIDVQVTPEAANNLTPDVDDMVGTGGNDTFEASANDLSWQDQIDGGAGNDTLVLKSGGYFNLADLTKLASIETLQGSSEDDVIRVSVEQLATIKTINGGGHASYGDTLSIEGTSIDMTGKSIAGIDAIELHSDNATITFDDADMAKLASGRYVDGDKLHLTKGFLSAAERQVLHDRGIDIIEDESGNISTNTAPQLANLHGDQIKLQAGGTALIDVGSNVILQDDDAVMDYLHIFTWNASTSGTYGIRTKAGEIEVSNGLNMFSRVIIDGFDIGYIASDLETTTWDFGILFNDNATVARVQKLLGALTHTSVSDDPNITDQYTLEIYVADKGGRTAEAVVGVIVEPASYVLTAGTDNLVGTAADEVFAGSQGTFFPGDQIDGGDGIDTFQLIDAGVGYNSLDLTWTARFANIEVISGTETDDRVSIGSGSLNDVITLSGGIGHDVLWLSSAVGGNFDLTGKTVRGFEEISLDWDVTKVTVDSVATAELINGYYSQNDHLHITSVDLTDAEREAYFLRGIDTITDKSGRVTSNLAPQVSGLDGDQVRVAPGGSVLLDAGQDMTLGLDDNDLFYLQFYALDLAYGDPNVHFEIQAGNGISLDKGMNIGSKITVSTANGDVVIGEISMWTDQWMLDIEFTPQATHELVEKLIKAVAYKNTSPGNILIARHQVYFYIEDNGGRSSEATIDVMVAPDTAQLLTDGLDDFVGTGAAEIFAAPLGTINQGDKLDGGDGIDTLQLETGTSNLTQFASLTRVEILSGSAGHDVIQVNAQNLAEVTAIRGHGGQDELQLVAAGAYNLAGKEITGIETISVRANASLTFDSDAVALLTHAMGVNASVTLQGGAFTQAQRAQLFRQGVKSITDNNGTSTNAAPDAISISGASVKEAAATGVIVGLLFADDPNSGEAFQFTLTDDAGGRFKLAADGRTVVVANGLLLDYEQAASHTIKVKVTDRGGLSYEKTLTIQVEDVNPESLLGTPGNDVLVGGSGAETLDGGAGADRMEGRGGNDTYFVDHVSDTVVEAEGGGDDHVFTSVDFTLGAFVEKLSATGVGALTLTGNGLNNTLAGNMAVNRLNGGAGADTLAGGLGNDRLYGGAGKDVFVFDTRGHKSRNKDKILDWNAKDDTIRLDKAVFKKLPKGVLKAKFFTLGATAKDANDYIGVNKVTGDVWYDANGNKAGGQVIFAHIGKKPIGAADFFVF